eukprot:TRINITY_DN2428_c0_g2_i1.p1 TRINITY_DN2428_c0_g2~~TRINITY_DN2428_c0_g2_i1.p1  ORF type:complete len:259 (+),score=59.01 TRINITY_DN2428_c0_g2_i1:67-777(+)
MPSPQKQKAALPTEPQLKKVLRELIQKASDEGNLEKVRVKDVLRSAEGKFELEKGLLSEREKGNKDWTNKLMREVMSDFVEDNPSIMKPVPRRARSAYQIFMAENKGLPRAKLNENWKQMSDDDKKKFVTASNEEKAITKSSTEAKEKEKRKAAPKSAEKKQKTDKTEKAEKAEAKPAKKTAVSFFMKDQSNKDLAMEKLKLSKWNGIKCNAWLKTHFASLSDAEKKKWNEMEENQ